MREPRGSNRSCPTHRRASCTPITGLAAPGALLSGTDGRRPAGVRRRVGHLVRPSVADRHDPPHGSLLWDHHLRAGRARTVGRPAAGHVERWWIDLDRRPAVERVPQRLLRLVRGSRPVSGRGARHGRRIRRPHRSRSALAADEVVLEGRPHAGVMRPGRRVRRRFDQRPRRVDPGRPHRRRQMAFVAGSLRRDIDRVPDGAALRGRGREVRRITWIPADRGGRRRGRRAALDRDPAVGAVVHHRWPSCGLLHRPELPGTEATGRGGFAAWYSSDSGERWSKGARFSGTYAPESLACTPLGTCWATSTATSVAIGPGNPGRRLVESTDGGRTWRTVALPSAYDVANPIGTWCTSTGTCWLLFDTSGIVNELGTTDGGVTWYTSRAGRLEGSVAAVDCTAPTACTAATSSSTGLRLVTLR